jgi:dienelactone hydrolase
MKALDKKYDPAIYNHARHGFMRLGEDESDASDKAAHDQAWERWKSILAGLTVGSAN